MARQRPKPHMNRSAIHTGHDPEAARTDRPETDAATTVAERPQAQDQAGRRGKGKAAAKSPADRRGRP